MGDSHQLVGVLASAADGEIAERVTTRLSAAQLGLVQGDHSVPDVLVMVLSATSVTDPQFRASLVWTERTRLVPIAVGAVRSEGLPDPLGGLNWILWDAAAPERSLAQVLSATRTDLIEYSASRSVEAKAWA